MNKIALKRRSLYRKQKADTDDVLGIVKKRLKTKGYLKKRLTGYKGLTNENHDTIASLCEFFSVEVPAHLTNCTIKDVVFTSRLAEEGVAVLMSDLPIELMKEDIELAADKNVAAIFIDKNDYEQMDDSHRKMATFIPVENAKEKFIAFYTKYRDAYTGIVVTVTGSVGKTTTKQYIRHIVRQHMEVFVSPANDNRTHAVAKNIRKSMAPGYKAFVHEVGARFPGTIDYMSKMLKPNIAVLTNIKEHHISEYLSIEGVFKDKISTVDNLQEGGYAVINKDDEYLANYDYKCNVVTVGIDSEDADYRALNIKQEGSWLSLDVLHDGKTCHVSSQITGEANAYNILEAFAVGKLLGVPENKIVKGIAEYKPFGTRQNVEIYGGNILYMDCYNVTNDSIIASAKNLEAMTVPEGARRIAIIGPENNLGEKMEESTRDLGRRLSEIKLDQIVCYGCDSDDEEALNYYGDAITLYDELKNRKCENIKLIRSTEDLAQYLQNEIKKGDAVLFKAIVYLNMPAAIDKALGTHYCVKQRLVKEKAEHKTINGFTGYIVPDMDEAYLDEVSNKQLSKKSISIPNEWDGKPIFGINKGLFAYSDAEKLDLGNTIKQIGLGAFIECKKIKEVDIPDSVLHIREGAFRGCSNINKLTLGANVIQIDTRAFKGCNKLKVVEYKGENLPSIADGAFPEKVTFKKYESNK